MHALLCLRGQASESGFALESVLLLAERHVLVAVQPLPEVFLLRALHAGRRALPLSKTRARPGHSGRGRGQAADRNHVTEEVTGAGPG